MMQQTRHGGAERSSRRETPLADAAPAGPPGRVRLVAGVDVEDMDLAGRRVADARAVAQAIFGIHADAAAVVDGRAADEDVVLAAGQVLEFVKHAGQKGAGGAPLAGSTIELSGANAVWRRNGEQLGALSVRELLGRAAVGGGPETWRLHPRHVRLMAERGRGHVVGVVVEMPPGPRRVRWVTEDSPADYGPEACFETRDLSFPWVVLVLVFAAGELSMVQQAFYRTAPIASLADELCFTNLLNVARGYEQDSWVCLVNVRRRLGRLTWDERVRIVSSYFWQSAFTRSSERAEGNSWWGNTRGLDTRLATPAAWEDATRADPYFTLQVRWPPTGRSVGDTLAGMLDMVAPWRPVERVEHLVTLMQQEKGR